ncbi:MAG TPA: hypothetical protein VI932_06865 [Bacteroidota bacterium]|nr:hypothetical protein [Bacteroidota bacterium]
MFFRESTSSAEPVTRPKIRKLPPELRRPRIDYPLRLLEYLLLFFFMKEENLFRFKNIGSPMYDHARGKVPKYGPQD